MYVCVCIYIYTHIYSCIQHTCVPSHICIAWYIHTWLYGLPHAYQIFPFGLYVNRLNKVLLWAVTPVMRKVCCVF